MENKVESQEFCASCWFIYILCDEHYCSPSQTSVVFPPKLKVCTECNVYTNMELVALYKP